MRLRRANRTAAAPAATLQVPRQGTVVALELVDVDRVWRSQVDDQQGATLVVLAPSRPKGPPILPDVGRAVTVGWPTPVGYLEAEAVLTATTDGKFATWTLEVSRSALSQRRSAYRLDARLQVTLATEAYGALTAVSRNIAEGGVACELPGRQDFEVGERMHVSVHLPEIEVASRGRVVRSAAMVPDGSEVVLAFEDLPEESAEPLRQFVFEQQLARRAIER
ncbi:PilZ domain-containing protein [Egicoccus sp. AB-alg6-2]|uniref:PilZ domain-containing protein n=1 Tax=Egicoccus sp. AB-alg6-2 TaxID=3242692 RepID=UPI00359E9F10